MRVLRYEPPVTQWRKSISCFHCKSLLEVTFDDLIPEQRSVIGDSYGAGHFEQAVAFTCPVCQEGSVIGTRDIAPETVAAVHKKFLS